ncbi:hypothetical protein Tco_1292705 [Tanacetum coccineum]
MQSNKNEWKDMLHQTKVFKYIAKSKEVGTLRYLSLVVPLKKVGDEAVHKELGDRMERAATTASSFEAEQDSVAASTRANGKVELTATIDGHIKTIIAASLRRHLKLEDKGGVTSLPNSEIFEQLALMGYVTDSDKLTFQKEVPLFPTMLTATESSPSRITSSPSLSPEPSLSPQHTPSTSQPQNTQPTPDAEEAALTPHESPLHSVYSLGRDEGSLSLTELTVLCTNLSNKVTSLESELQQTKQTYNAALTKLIKRVKKLEQTIKTSKAMRRVKIVVSEDEDASEDSSKQGRKISDIDEDPNISLVVLEEEEPTKLIEDQGSGEKSEKEVTTPANFQTYIRRRKDVSTGSGRVSTASRQDGTADVSTASEIGSIAGEKAKDKEEINIAGKKEAVTKDDEAHDIDWSDPSVIRYHALQNKPRSVAKVRKNMIMYLKNQGGYKMKDFKRMKSAGQEVQEESAETQKNEEIDTKQVEEEIVQQDDVVDEQVVKESTEKARGRKKSRARKRGKESLSEERSKK